MEFCIVEPVDCGLRCCRVLIRDCCIAFECSRSLIAVQPDFWLAFAGIHLPKQHHLTFLQRILKRSRICEVTSSVADNKKCF